MAQRPKPSNASVRLDNAPLHTKHPEDTYIAGGEELVSALEASDAVDEDAALNEEEEVDEMELDAKAALADGMGADDARAEARADDPKDTRNSDLRTDIDENSPGEAVDDEEFDAILRPTIH